MKSITIRDLTVTKSSMPDGMKEFNHLRVVNLQTFLDNYQHNLDYYTPPFKILAELEQRVMFANIPPRSVVCSYNPHGNMVFKLVTVSADGPVRIVSYRFDTTVK